MAERVINYIIHILYIEIKSWWNFVNGEREKKAKETNPVFRDKFKKKNTAHDTELDMY